jgi:hypothetical protein
MLKVDRQVRPILLARLYLASAMLPKPNCCKRPHLHAVQILDKTPEDQLAIFRCDACETYWRAAINAWAMLDGSIDEIGGFHKLTTDEAVKVLRATR